MFASYLAMRLSCRPKVHGKKRKVQTCQRSHPTPTPIVANPAQVIVATIDPRNDRIVASLRVKNAVPNYVAAGKDSLWI